MLFRELDCSIAQQRLSQVEATGERKSLHEPGLKSLLDQTVEF